MKRWLIFILFLIFISSANAIGLAVSENTKLNFFPNSEHEFTFYVISASGLNIETFLDGDLKKYTEISKIYGDKDEYIRYFNVKISLPDKLESGMHGIGIGVREKGEYSGASTGVNTLTSVIVPIKLFVPYEGKYIEAELVSADGNINEVIPIKIKLKNLGEENLSKVYSDIEVYDFNEKKTDAVQTNKISLNIFQEDEIYTELNLSGYSYGDYQLKAFLHYDGEAKMLDGSFRVGTYSVKINDYTKKFYPNDFNEFRVFVESQWNGVIDNVYAIIEVNEKEIKTTGTSLNSFQQGELIAYWNPGNISFGEYPVNITLFYADKETRQKGSIFIIEKTLTLREKLSPFIIPSLVAVLIALMIFNMHLVLKLNKRK